MGLPKVFEAGIDASGGDVIGLVKVMPITFGECTNTAAETTVITVPVKADEWRAGQVIQIDWLAAWKNISGVGQTITVKVKYGTDAHTYCTDSVSNSGVETVVPVRTLLYRAGNDLRVAGWDFSYGYAAVFHPGAINAANGVDMFAAGRRGGTVTNPGFSTDKNLVITITLSAADPNFYYKVGAAAAVKA